MNKLLKYWQTNVRCPIDSIANGQQPQRRLKDPSRRLTTTISRSVKIQTDSDGKRFEEKGVTTDDLLQPIIERPMVAKTINTFHVCSDNKDNILIDLDPLPSQQTKPQTSPLPIVEMYSDTDDDDDDDDDWTERILCMVRMIRKIRQVNHARNVAVISNSFITNGSIPTHTHTQTQWKRKRDRQL